VIILLLAAGTVLAQADNAFQKFPEGVEESVYRVRVAGEGEFQGARIQPPSWFVDLPTRRVEVMLYDEGIGAQSLTLEGTGAQLLEVTRVANDNYLYAEVLVEPLAQPTNLTFRTGDGRSYPWPLQRAKTPSPLTPADLLYLIMPDRFANGDPSNDSVAELHQQGIDRGKFLFRHGGDLAGITQHLDYLVDLGVTALWLNPVLENDQPYESYHGYAVTDHYRIDRRFGSLNDYQELVDEAHDRGIKVLMDIVPNHAGDKHFLYTDLPANDWFHQPDGFVRSNFRIPSVLDPHVAPSDHRQMLDGWFDHHMPDFNQDNPRVRRYFTQLALWWIGHTGQDGYRVDTYPYSDPDFMAEWSEEIHANFPTIAFFGEVWVDGLPNQASFVPGNDSPVEVGANPSVTDFQLKDAIHAAMHQPHGWVDGVGKLWLTLTQDYMYAEPDALITFLDNHDLTRLATSMGGDEVKIKSALTLLLTLRGTPMLYYGTEVALEGTGGAFGEGGRKDMPGGWADDVSNAFTASGLSAKQLAIQQHVRKLGTYRRDNPGLATGKLTHHVPVDGIYTFLRVSPDEQRRWLVIYNSNEQPQTVEPEQFGGLLKRANNGTDVLTGVRASLGDGLMLGAKTVRVFEIAGE